MLTALAVSNYRSLRSVVVPLGRLTVITGPNGSGKSNLYRALRLVTEAARGRLIAALAQEGGLPSTLWAGPETPSAGMRAGTDAVQGTVRRDAVHLRLGFASHDFGYAADLGLPVPSSSAFSLDPEVKRECIWAGPICRRASLLVDRRGPALRATDEAGVWQTLPHRLSPFDSMLTELSDPRGSPEVIVLRERMRAWRFYDHLRSDAEAPARRHRVATRTPALADDGGDLAAALQTIREVGDPEGLDAAIDGAFPGSRLEIAGADGRLEIALRRHGLLRSLRAGELSDGTIRYLLLVAALLTPRPPELIVLNEPETSLHPDLLPALARLIAGAADTAQILVVTHQPSLAAALGKGAGSCLLRLETALGETRVNSEIEAPRWEWPAR